MATARRRRRGAQAVLGLQRSRDFFKSATRNINAVIFLVRVIAVFFLFLLMSRTWNSLSSKTKNWDDFRLLIQILVLYFFAFFLALLTIPAMISNPLSSALAVPALSTDYFNSARAFVLTNLFGNYSIPSFFDKDHFLGSGDPTTPLAYILNKPTRNNYNTECLHGVILLMFILMFITGIGFVRRSSVNLAGMTLVISQVIIALAYMKGLAVQLTLHRADNGYISFSDMLSSPLFQLAFISYFYFEFSLQTGYLYSLANPALTRQKRVGKQLSKLSEFRLGVTKLGTDEEKATQKAKEEKISVSAEGDTAKTSTALATTADSTSARKFGADALIFLLDSAQDSLFAKPGGEEERLTGRLQRYHDGLLAHDPKFDEKLGGSAGKAFNPFLVLLTLVGSMAIRVFVLLILAWMSINPSRILDYIALPKTITSSIEIGQPEGILLVLIPVIFFLIGFSYIIARLQRVIVKAEELIISEAEIGKLLKAGKAIRSRKQMEEYQAAQAAKLAAETANQTDQTATTTKPTKKTRKRRVKKRR